MAWRNLADGVFFRRYQPWDVNVGVVIGTAGVLLIDTRANAEEGAELRAHLAELDPRPPRWIVNTHAHFDHIGGNGCFPEAAVIAGNDAVADAVADAGGTVTVDLGGRTVDVRHLGRGHTGEDVVVLAPGVVFAGDLVEESGPPQYDELSDPAEWPATNRRLLELIGAGDLVVPGHGEVVDRRFVAGQLAELERAANDSRGSGG